MLHSLAQKTLADKLPALAQKASADKLPALAPEPEEPLGSQHSEGAVTLALWPLAHPQRLVGKPAAEVVGLAMVVPGWVCCGIPRIHSHWCQQVQRRQGHLRWSCRPEHRHFQARMSVVGAQ